jgi:choice-of-anchor C domain-containing protein
MPLLIHATRFSLALTALLSTSVQAQNLLTNSSFEQPVVSSPFLRFEAPSTGIPGWSVVSGNLDLCASVWQQTDGLNSLDMDGDRAGAIEQTFITQPGQCYTVLFQFSGNPSNLPRIKTMRIEAAGESTTTQFDTAGRSFQNMGWELRTWQFTASAGQTTLRFTSLNNLTGWGPALDNVRVFAGPVVLTQPASQTRCPGGTATFSVGIAGTSPATYQWRVGGVAIDASANPSALTSTLVIPQIDATDAAAYDVVVTTTCGTVTSEPASLVLCFADINCDDFLDFFDYSDFVVAFENGDASADFNGDDFLDFFDYADFVQAFEAGC